MARLDRRFAGPRGGWGEPDDHRGRGFLYVILAVVLVAFGGVVWNLYGGVSAPRVLPEYETYKTTPIEDPSGAATSELSALESALEGRAETAGEETVRPRPAPEAPLTGAPEAPVAPRPHLGSAPAFSSTGAFAAQLAAVRSEAAAEIAWQRLSTRAPGLFASAQRDVQRADLGARGTYFRLRAGYFADRENVGLFCDRIRSMGQDCIAVPR